MSKIKVLIALCITLLLLAVSCIMAGEEYKDTFSKTLPLKAGERFSLENVNGGVAIATWKEDKVEIKAVKIARRNKEDLDKVEIRVDEGAGSVSVKAVWPKFPRRANVNVEFTIMVPEGVNLDEVETVNGGVEVTGRYGRAEVGTTNGSVTVKDASGELEAGTTNGDVRVNRFDGRLEGGHDQRQHPARRADVQGRDRGRDDQRLHHAGHRLPRSPQCRLPGQHDERPHHGGFPRNAPEPAPVETPDRRPDRPGRPRDLSRDDQRLDQPDEVSSGLTLILSGGPALPPAPVFFFPPLC